MAVEVVVEDVRRGELSEGEDEMGRLPDPREMQRVRSHRLVFTTEINGLAEKEPREINLRHGRARPRGLPIRKSCDPERLAKALPLCDFGNNEELSPLPESSPDEERRGDRLLELALGLEAVCALIGRADREATLAHERRLGVQAPVLR